MAILRASSVILKGHKKKAGPFGPAFVFCFSPPFVASLTAIFFVRFAVIDFNERLDPRAVVKTQAVIKTLFAP